MARGINQKAKLLRLVQIFYKETDKEHGITMNDILDRLEQYGIQAERKSIYDDLETLGQVGIRISSRKEGKNYIYFLEERMFELSEMKLLVDAVQSSKFITKEKSNKLIGKIELLASRNEAESLQRQVFVTDRIKTMNESIFNNIDKIHSAINSNRMINFKYFEWTVSKEREYRHNGAVYEISPWGLIWDDENYYLVGFDSGAGIIKHFRVDKMDRLNIADKEREGRETFKEQNFNTAKYANKVFGMYGGRELTVDVRFRKHLAGVVIDRFGKDVAMRPDGDDWFLAHLDIMDSPVFMGWLMGFGTEAEIIGPEEYVDKFYNSVRELNKLYKK